MRIRLAAVWTPPPLPPPAAGALGSSGDGGAGGASAAAAAAVAAVAAAAGEASGAPGKGAAAEAGVGSMFEKNQNNGYFFISISIFFDAFLGMAHHHPRAGTPAGAPLVPWRDSLLLPMIALPCAMVATVTALYYCQGEAGCPRQYTVSSDNEVSVYLCCAPEKLVGLGGLGGTLVFGLCASFQVNMASLLTGGRGCSELGLPRC
jgi:hypothetical protein